MDKNTKVKLLNEKESIIQRVNFYVIQEMWKKERKKGDLRLVYDHPKKKVNGIFYDEKYQGGVQFTRKTFTELMGVGRRKHFSSDYYAKMSAISGISEDIFRGNVLFEIQELDDFDFWRNHYETKRDLEKAKGRKDVFDSCSEFDDLSKEHKKEYKEYIEELIKGNNEINDPYEKNNWQKLKLLVTEEKEKKKDC